MLLFVFKHLNVSSKHQFFSQRLEFAAGFHHQSVNSFGQLDK
jgi:hypothetical protein